jgi:hypothetical protein
MLAHRATGDTGLRPCVTTLTLTLCLCPLKREWYLW